MDASSAHAYDQVSQYYDRLRDHWAAASAAQCAQALAALVGTGTALELGIGTGRIALPLAAGGAAVCGIDNSPGMLDMLRAKPGAERLTLVCADFVDVPVAGPFDLIYSVYSLGYLLTQDDQLRCLRAVRERLATSGVFVLQTMVPQAETLLADGKVRSLEAPALDEGDVPVMLMCSSADPARQLIQQRIVMIGESATRVFNDRYRYLWPSELDLMARIAGLRLRARWGDWTGQPYTARSRSQISVYEPAAMDADEASARG
ncbi:trans-aconitate 2-methyltransferase [Xanthomonas axonopodis]|uniref:class I SAM-dependent methyltransferase n=1 Tax=Xanthomonas axonopodis TaxID=53413 RepID=UPI00355625CA